MKQTSEVVQKGTSAWSAKLKDALRAYIRSNTRGVEITADSLAAGFVNRETELVRGWAIAEITRQVRASIRAAQPPHPYQMFLVGFTGMAARVPLKNGFTRVGKATPRELRESVSVMIAADKKKAVSPNPKIALARALLAEMGGWAQEHPDLSVARYCEMRAAGEI